jgi:hypothetical protein
VIPCGCSASPAGGADLGRVWFHQYSIDPAPIAPHLVSVFHEVLWMLSEIKNEPALAGANFLRMFSHSQPFFVE